jgi:UV DNA damage repair endonuclease
LFHLSESKPGVTLSHSLTERRAHSDYVNSLPEALIELIKTERINLDIEAKMKEQAIIRLYNKYPFLN